MKIDFFNKHTNDIGVSCHGDFFTDAYDAIDHGPEESINSEFDLKSRRDELSFDDAYTAMRSLTTLGTDDDEDHEGKS